MSDRTLCLSLYLCSKEFIKVYKKYLDEYDLTYTQFICLKELSSFKKLYVKELGDKLYLDSGTLSPLLKKLEAKRYIKRIRCNKDERNLCVLISPEGESLIQSLEDVSNKVRAEIKMNDKDIKNLLGMLDKLLINLA